MKCSNCNESLLKTDGFCGNCGTKVPKDTPVAKDACQWCDTPYKPKDTHCSKCGTIRGLQNKDAHLGQADEDPTGDRVWHLILLVVGGAIALGCLISFFIASNALNTMKGNDPSIGLQAVMSVIGGLVGLVIFLAGLFGLNRDASK